MSIVPLVRLTLVAPAAEREPVLTGLQALGRVHLDSGSGDGAGKPESGLDTAIAWLATASPRRRPDRRPDACDPAAVVEAALAARSRGEALAEERARLLKRIADVRPWGRFTFRDLADHPELRLWFYRVAPADLDRLQGHIWAEVGKSGDEHRVVVIAAEEPMLGLARQHLGSRTLDELEARLADVEMALDDVAAERVALTRFLPHLRAARDRLADAAARAAVGTALPERGPLVVIEGWAAAEDVPMLSAWAETMGIALHTRPPAESETPPTRLANPPETAPGEALVGFFTTPDYRAWDPSAVVMASFILFFAVIVSDAVYGLALAVVLALAWRRLGRTRRGRATRRLVAWLAGATIVWGLLAGVYAGKGPPHPILERLKWLPSDNLEAMLRISIGIGIAHLALANALAARRLWPQRTAFARLGWIAILLSVPAALLLPAVALPAWLAAGAGLAAILAFGSRRQGLGARLVDGAGQVARLVSAMGDTLSYLRLFALALAGSALAGAFNALAGDASRVPGAGAVLALLVLLLGHGLNLALSVASGVVHGLRLTYIEFLGWALWGEGRPFRPFRRQAETG